MSSLAQGNWDKKFESALSVKDKETKAHYDRLMALRNELRNHVAHGAFGTDGAAYYFHSKTGAVPVLLPHKSRHHQFKLGDDLQFDESSAITAMNEFAVFLWSGERKPARLYIQESDLPIILASIKHGTYAKAMSSVRDMKTFIDCMTEKFDRAANMDW